MVEEIVWEDPPSAGRGNGPTSKWLERLAPLRERPGQWAMVGRYHTSTVTHIRKGLIAGLEAGEFEAVGRNGRDAKCDLYVRYVGKPKIAAAS